MNKLSLCCLILCSLVCTNLFAKKGDAADRKKHADYYEKYDKHLNEQIDQLPDLTGCDDIDPDTVAANGEKELAICVKEQLNGIEKSAALKIEEILELKTHNLIKSKKKKDIVNFLGDKFEDRLHENTNKNRKRQDRKFVDERDYITLYKNQLANNALLEIASFCRERVLIPDSCHEIDLQKQRDCHISNIKIGKKTPTQLLKEQKELGKIHSIETTKPIAAVKHTYCMRRINELCKSTNENHHEACLLRERLTKTELAIDETKRIESIYDNHRSNGGYRLEDTKAYSGRIDRSKLEDLGAITSDLVHDSEAKEEMAELDEEFKRECEAKGADTASEACKQFFNVMTQKDLDSIKNKLAQKEAITNLKLDSLQDDDEDKFKEIAGRYLSKKDLENPDIDAIRVKLNDELKAQKAAIIKSIEDKVAQGTKKEEIVEDIKIDVQKEIKKAEDIKISKANALRDNIFYSNMVNSYLERSQGDKTSDNSKFRERELRAAGGIQDDQDYITNVKAVQAFVDKTAQSSGGQKQDDIEGTLDQLGQLFDWVVRGQAPEKKKTK